ncbi:hypothetical protein [Spiroplasma cantharicola]|uniref:PvuRts1 I-like SET and RING associated domain-containing protein n=1 Tax=Spiroplasma cantharicola TaxID=362837 RepID=A0A0M4KFI7_9MOLU|nr:hypothetical protein [Spiroplasma cantharicola]ALD66920.1 hypothetical protein SCANT_v1c10140 [Spiroplasma cantharicola]
MEKEIINIKEDHETYELISEVIFKFFTKKGKSILTGSDNRINETTRVWFINFVETKKKEEIMQLEKYAIFPSDDLKKITLYNNTGSEELIAKRYEKIKNEKNEIIVFAKFKDSLKYKGYKFLGLFEFDDSLTNEKNTLIFTKTKSSIKLDV